MSKFLDKLDIDVDKNEELFITVEDKWLKTGIANESKILLIHGILETSLPDIQIPVAHFTNLKSAVSTFKGDVSVNVDKRLILKGKNTKKIPMCKWDIQAEKIQKIIDEKTEGAIPILIQKDEIDILSQDFSIYDKLTEVFVIVKNKTLNIIMKDETGFECNTEIKDVHLDDGEYILPTIVFKILKKAENIELYLGNEIAYIRDKGERYEIRYLVNTKE